MLKNFPVSFVKTVARHLLEITFNRVVIRDWVERNLVNGFREFQVAHISNVQRVVQPFRLFAKIRPHFLGGAKVIFGRTVAQAVRIIDRFSSADTQQTIVRFDIIGVQVMRII